MVADRSRPDDGEDRLCEILLEFLESAERGESPDTAELLARNPEFAPQLRDFLETREQLEGLTAPLRWVSQSLLGATHSGGAVTLTGGAGPAAVAKGSVGDYEILDVIGRGGMGVVCKARHRALNRLVALKMVSGAGPGGEDVLRRFGKEAETVAALDHPNIVPIYEIGAEDGNLFFTMKLMEGGSLKDRLTEFKADPRAAARLVATVARAVAHAHRRGVLHRDLKPSNVLLDAAGRPHVADFGLAKWLGSESERARGSGHRPLEPALSRLLNGNDLTQTGVLLGTPSYMAPEQASPDPRPCPGPGQGPNTGVTTATDVYGLGAVLYALLTGGPPFQAPTTMLTLERVRADDPEPPRSRNPRVDRDLEAVCLKCLEKDPAKRYRSADELAEELDHWLAGAPVRARRVSVTRRLTMWCRRHPGRAALVGAALLLVALPFATLAAAFVLVGRERDRALALEARAEAREAEARQQLYAAHTALAHRAWLKGDVNGMGRVLDLCLPKPGEADLRDVAWRLLDPLRQADPLAQPLADPAHPSAVYGVALSPDGKTLASAGKDGTVRVRRVGADPVLLRGHTGEVNWVSFDGEAKRLATAGDDGTARVWDLAAGTPPRVITGHKGEVVAAEFTRDGSALVTAGVDGWLRKWHLPSGELAWQQPAGGDRIQGLAVSSGRQGEKPLVATAGKDGFVKVWDLASGAMRFGRQLTGQCQCVAFGPFGYALAVGDSGGHIWILASHKGEPLATLHVDNGCSVEGVAFSPDAMTLASCGMHGRVRVWDLRSNSLLRNLDCEDVRVWCVTFSPDGRRLVCGASDGVIRTWNADAAHAARFLPAPAGDAAVSLTFSPDGGTLAVAGGDGTVNFWNPRTCRPRSDLRPWHLPGTGRRLVRFDPDGLSVGVCGPDGTLERRSPDGSPLPGKLAGPGREPLALCCRPKGAEWLACLQQTPPLRWDPADGGAVRVDLGGEPCAAAVWSPDGEVLAASVPGGVRLVRAATGEVLPLRHTRSEWVSPVVAFSPDGRRVAAVDSGGVIVLWDVAGPRAEVKDRQPLQLQGRQLAVKGLAFSPDGKVLASGGEDGTVKVWHVATLRELYTLRARLGSSVGEVAFAPDGRCLAAACANHDHTNEVALWPASAP